VSNVSIIIDGYNVIRTCGLVGSTVGPGSLERARGVLLGMLAQAFPAQQRDGLTVVFDSALRLPDLPAETQDNGIRVLFASGHEDADEMIIQMIRRHSAPKSLLVVSSDHQIQIAAKRRRAAFVDSDQWFEQTIARRRAETQKQVSAEQLKLEVQLSQKQGQRALGASETQQWLAAFDQAFQSLDEDRQSALTRLAREPAPRRVAGPSDTGPSDTGPSDTGPSELGKTELGKTLPASLPQAPGISASTAAGSAAPVQPGNRGGGPTARPRSPHEPPQDPRRDTPANTPTGKPSGAAAQESAAGPTPPAAADDSHVQTLGEIDQRQWNRWNRQLESTSGEIFPPGYGEDVIFSESFEIDDRLKRRRRGD